MTRLIILCAVVSTACTDVGGRTMQIEQSPATADLHYVSHEASSTELTELATSREDGERGFVAKGTDGLSFWMPVKDVCSPRIVEHPSWISFEGDPDLDVLLKVDRRTGIAMQAYTCSCGGTDTGGCSPFSVTKCVLFVCKTIEGCTAGCDVCSGHE